MIVTLEQARAMRWPFRNPRQPMGLLLDQGAISVPDLQRASRAAYSPRFKAACLLLLREMTPPSDPAPTITRSVSLLDQFPLRLLPNTCPICESKLRVNGSAWECVADRTHYWQHRVQRLCAARQQWIDGLPPEEQQYRAEIWQTACDLDEREQFLSEHALKYPAGS
jgi:hypothetical protein